MGRSLNRLTTKAIEKVKTPGYYADGGGLYLQVTSANAKSWVFRYTRDGRAREMGLGSLIAVSLADARDKAAGCRKQLAENIDPLDARKAANAARSVAAAKTITFGECADAYIAAHRAGWKNAKHAEQWKTTLAAYACPIIGALPVSSIDVGLVMQVLEPIWATKTETASRLRGRIEKILDWAKTRGYREGDNPARWRGNLDNQLPKRSKVAKVEHHSALPYADLGDFMAELRDQEGIAARSLEFAILTAARTGEVIEARWPEVHFRNATWIVPEGRMKSGKEHRVPLCARAVAILKEMKAIEGDSDFVFPGRQSKKPLSNMALLAVLKRMDREDLTVHGFRSTFRDWAGETTAYPREVVEHALAHQLKDKAEAAYARGTLFEKRRRLMDDWGAYCAVRKKAARKNVVPIRKGKTE